VVNRPIPHLPNSERILNYKVIVQDAAIRDAREYAAFIRKKSKDAEAARRWLDALEALIQALAEMPNRYKVIEEQEDFQIRLQQVIHFSHRVIYHVDERTQTVHVLRIYHGARRPLISDDVDEPNSS
jgi:toxin ParE1/3/4